MALKLTILPTSPILQRSAVQVLDYYVHVAGIHYIKDNNVCSLPVRYYAIDANNEPIGPQLIGTGLTDIIPVMRPQELLMSQDVPAVVLVYKTVRDHLSALCGPGTVVTDLL